MTDQSIINGVRKDDLIDYLTSKRIILVGNSLTLLNSDHSHFIDSFDCVIRMNHGIPHACTGRRTDIWVCNYCLKNKIGNQEEDMLKEDSYMNPKYIIRFPLTPNTKKYTPRLVNKTYFGEVTTDHSLFFRKGQGWDSSTGSKMIDLLTNQFELSVHIIGFDFFETGTWYRPNGFKYAECHDPNREKDYVLSNDKVIYHECN